MVRLLNVYTISSFVALAGLLFGFDISSISGVVGTDQYKNFFGNPLGTRQGGITTAIQSASNGVAMLIAGRLVSGLCIGLTSSLVPIYQSEIAPRKIRGRIVVFQVFAITWGIMIQYFIQYGCSFIDSEAAFRIPWAIQAIPAIFLIIGLFWLPRSPRWLASVDRWDDALRVLAFLRSAVGDINDPLVLAEYKEIEDQIRTEREEHSNSYRELFSRKIRKRLFLSMAIQMWSQLSGMNVMMYYIVYPKYVINKVMTIPCLIWTDQWGRRPSLLIGAISMSIWFFVIGGLLLQYGEPNPVANEPYTWVIHDNTAVSRTILAASYLAVGTFAVAWAPINWIYPPEVAPLRVRAKSVSLATAANWGTNFALGFAVPPLLRSMKSGMFFLPLVAVPETKQRTLEEMDEIFEHGKPLWKSFTGIGDTNKLDRLAREIELGLLTNRYSPVHKHDG
ncbi:hypothetical protein V1522DRAFT_460729 [Lipomyces starkeyi]